MGSQAFTSYEAMFISKEFYSGMIVGCNSIGIYIYIQCDPSVYTLSSLVCLCKMIHCTHCRQE